MTLNNWPKFIGLLVVGVGIIILLALGRVSEAGGFGLLGIIIGYLAGNGVAAKSGEKAEPVLAPRESPSSSAATTDDARP